MRKGLTFLKVKKMIRVLIPFFLLFIFAFQSVSIIAQDSYKRFEKVWNDFNNNYSYFQEKGVDWDLVKAQFAPVFSKTLSEKEEAENLGRMLLTLKDQHVSLTIGKSFYNYRKPFIGEKKFKLNPIFKTEIINQPSIKVYKSNDSMLYIKISGLDTEIAKFENLFTEMRNSKGIIIDLRNNGGGNERYGRDFVEKIITDKLLYKTFRFTKGSGRNQFNEWQNGYLTPNNANKINKPIIVIINEGCYSSCEGVVLMFKAMKNVSVVGSRTGGSSGYPKKFELENGWSYTISTWQEADMNHQLIEDNGVKPDVEIPVDVDPVEWSIKTLAK